VENRERENSSCPSSRHLSFLAAFGPSLHFWSNNYQRGNQKLKQPRNTENLRQWKYCTNIYRVVIKFKILLWLLFAYYRGLYNLCKPHVNAAWYLFQNHFLKAWTYIWRKYFLRDSTKTLYRVSKSENSKHNFARVSNKWKLSFGKLCEPPPIRPPFSPWIVLRAFKNARPHSLEQMA